MQFVKVMATTDGGSVFGSVDIEQGEAPYAQNVPLLFVSRPVPVQDLMVVTIPEDVRNTEAHPAPRRQLVIVLAGQFEVETTDGDRRTFASGEMALFEDTTGLGHVTRVVAAPASFIAVSLASSSLG